MQDFIKSVSSILFIYLTFTGCSNDKIDPEPVNCEQSDLDIELTSSQVASDCSVSDGSVTVSATGGAGDYTFKIDNQNFQAESTFNGLAAGNYTIVVKDKNACESAISVTVGIQDSDLAITDVASGFAGCGESRAHMTVAATGEGTLMYKLGTGSFQSSNTFRGLAAGSYEVVVKDDSDCEVSTTTKVLNGTSYEDEVKAIITANCSVTACHDGSNGENNNWTVFSNVQAKADRIKELTQSGDMPKDDRTLTEEEKALIACWVDDGGLDN